MSTNQKPPKRRYRSKGCARCNGYGVLVVYAQPFIEHQHFAQAVGAANATTNEFTTRELREKSNALVSRAVPMACPDCRNLQEAASL